MKLTLNIIYFLLLMLFTSQLFATDWYAGNTSSGSNNGTNWANKWSVSSINWTSVQAGDYVYLDGGVDSLVYGTSQFMTIAKSGTFANRVTITVGANSPDPTNHSGKVIFDGVNGTGTAFQIRATGSGRNYITVEGRHNGVNWITCRNIERGANIEDVANLITISGLNVYNYTGQGGVMINGASEYSIDSCIVRYCKIISIENDASQSDGIYMQRAQRILLHDNWIRQRNQDPLAHTDCIQAYLVSGAVLYNNVCINDSVNSPEGGGTPMILGADGDGTKNILIYNNFLYMGGIWYATGSQNSAWWSRSYTDQYANCWFVNNTVVVNGPRCRAAIFEYQTYAVNNIFAMYNGATMANLEENLPNSIYVDSTRNNIFYKEGSNPSFAGSFTGSGGSPTGTNVTYSNWFTTYGGTGQFDDPDLDMNVGNISNQSLVKPDLLLSSPAIDAGNNEEDIEAYVDWLNSQGFDGNPHTGEWMLPKADIYGTSRTGTWDVGAFEYTDGTPAPVQTKKVRVIIIQ